MEEKSSHISGGITIQELTNEQKIANLKKATDVLLTLPESFSLLNGWNRRDLLLHLWTWDVEYIRLCEAKIKNKLKKFQFNYEELGMAYSNWNDYIMEKFEDLSEEDIKEQFITDRTKLLKLLEKLKDLPENDVPKEYMQTNQILDLWQHDKMHLNGAGFAVFY
ncbi:MAG: hypothetical protein ACFFDW_13510 [Candidatus Thorarchaeota archaeon]